MRDSNPHAREQLILSQPCLPFHQFPVNNMVGAAWFEHAMIVTRALVTIAPLCAGLCIPVPPSAYKIPNQSLEKYSGVLAPTSSMLFLTCLYDLLHKPCTEHSALSLVCSVGKRRTRRLPQQLSIAASLCGTAMFVAQFNMDRQRVGFCWLRVCLHDQQDSTLLL